MDTVEIVADAVMQFEGWFTKVGGHPSVSYRNRNPGNLMSGGSYRSFGSFVEGYEALLAELRSKFSGNNKHSIGPESTILELFSIYAPPPENDPTVYSDFVASWCSFVRGMHIDIQTKLKDI